MPVFRYPIFWGFSIDFHTSSTLMFIFLYFQKWWAWEMIFSCPGQLNRWPCHWVSQVLISASSEPCRAVVDRDMWPFWRLIKSVSRHGMLVCLYGFIDLNVYIMWQMVKRKMVLHQSFNYSNCWLYQFIIIKHTLQKRRAHFFLLIFAIKDRDRDRDGDGDRDRDIGSDLVT